MMETPAHPPSPFLSETIPVRKKMSDKAAEYHQLIFGIKNLPFSVFGIILALVGVNIAVWICVGIVLSFNAALVSTAVLAYALGLRHALDADHISAIDLTTRRLVAAGQRPVTLGMFFSLGHSTIVMITSVVVAATAATIRDKFDNYGHIGSIIGSSISAGFLIILGIMNMFILYKLVKQMNELLVTHTSQHREFKITGAGCLYYVFQKMFKLIDRPWKMYLLGVLFGLGFDTSSEVAILGISSIQAAKGTSMWLILIFPILFTGSNALFHFTKGPLIYSSWDVSPILAGMCLLDTTDGALMMTLYTSTAHARDQIAVLYYSIILTVITIIVAVVIGIIQLLSLILKVAEPEGRFCDGVEVGEDYYDIIGGAICVSFVVFGGISVALYGPWRRWVEGRKRESDGDGQGEREAEQDALLGQRTAEGDQEVIDDDTSLRRPGTGDVEVV